MVRPRVLSRGTPPTHTSLPFHSRPGRVVPLEGPSYCLRSDVPRSNEYRGEAESCEQCVSNVQKRVGPETAPTKGDGLCEKEGKRTDGNGSIEDKQEVYNRICSGRGPSVRTLVPQEDTRGVGS